MNIFTIRDLENLSGIKAHTIRIWEQRYSFLKPRRTETNIRYYSNDDLKTILNIALLCKNGFRISHIDRMSPDEIQERIITLNHAEAQQERMVNALIQSMAELDMDGFEEIVNRLIRQKGIERTIIQMFFPFLEKIGILWQTGHINPAQEHLVSNIIRQKLITGIDSVKPLVKLDETFLLFLPEGEHHELGLLFVYFLLKSRGARVFYLGANVPLKDVQSVVNIKQPAYIYIHLTSSSSDFNLEKLLNNLSQKIRGYDIIISGLITHSYRKKIPAGIEFKKSLGEVMEFIASI